jgi:hypothetical protein
MKVVFSEATPDYSRYAFPYVVWGFPEPSETPADFFDAGFLPSSPQLDRFYLCRQLRVPLKEWKSTSENRRVLRKGIGLECRLVPRVEFDFSTAQQRAWLAYAEERFGQGVMPAERLNRLMASPVISHLLVFRHAPSATEVGWVLMYLEPPRVAYYYFAFYDLNWAARNLGMFMMTRAVEFFLDQGYQHLHLGTCYQERALYKAQFEPLEYSTGWGWSRDSSVLKALVRQPPHTGHLLEDPQHPATQALQGLDIAHASRFQLGFLRPSLHDYPGENQPECGQL